MPNSIPIAVGGTVPEGSLYVERRGDTELSEHIGLNRWVNLYGSRLEGKSSLVTRTQRRMRESGMRVGYLTLENIVMDEARPPFQREFFEGLRSHWEDDLSVETGWEPANVEIESGSAFRSLIDRLLLTIPDRILLILDEIDILTRLPYGTSLLNQFRLLHEERARNPEHYQRLVIVLVGQRPIADLVDPQRGVAGCSLVSLEDFEDTERTIMTLGDALPESDAPDELAKRILWHTRGQPLLTMLILDWLRRNGRASLQDIDSLASGFRLRKMTEPESLFRTAKRVIVEDRRDSTAALSTYIGILNNDSTSKEPTAPGADLLLASGIVCKREGKLTPKCPIFEVAFDKKWSMGALSDAATERGRFRVTAHRKDRKKVCIINTGGTIGMVQRGERVVAPDSAEEFLAYHQELAELADIDFVQLFALDSINIYPADWIALSRFIYDRRRKGYAGFVVAHGTDTMTFTASAVALALGPNLWFPVVFTGSQTTPDKYYGDARTNLYRAVLTAQQNLHEVTICFGDRVFRACRAQKRDDQRFEGFESPTYPELAIITEEVNVRHELLRDKPHPGLDIQLQDRFVEGVLEIAQHPGLEPKFFSEVLNHVNRGNGPRCNGVIIQTLGAGNIATREPYSLLGFVQQTVKELKIPVLITSQYPPDAESYKKYSPAQAPVDAGAIHAGTMTSAAALVKFCWVLAQVQSISSPEDRIDQVRRMMVEVDYVGELAQPSKKRGELNA